MSSRNRYGLLSKRRRQPVLDTQGKHAMLNWRLWDRATSYEHFGGFIARRLQSLPDPQSSIFRNDEAIARSLVVGGWPCARLAINYQNVETAHKNRFDATTDCDQRIFKILQTWKQELLCFLRACAS